MKLQSMKLPRILIAGVSLIGGIIFLGLLGLCMGVWDALQMFVDDVFDIKKE